MLGVHTDSRRRYATEAVGSFVKLAAYGIRRVGKGFDARQCRRRRKTRSGRRSGERGKKAKH